MKKLGKYELLEPLGSGGFGTVYRARDTILGREVALKVLHPQLMVDLEFVERFRAEAVKIASLEHPNIVTIYDLGEDAGRVFIAMRYLPGGSLRDLLKQEGHLSYARALTILEQVSAGLGAAHGMGLVHRDIKPENILFTKNGQAVLADFGLARAILASSSSSTGGVGTPCYRAPELWRGKPPACPATDEYSLACVFVEMLTGNQLFAGDTPEEIITKHLVDGPALPKEWPDNVPSGLSDVIDKALAKDPEKRYQNMEQLLATLEELTLGRESTGQPDDARNPNKKESITQGMGGIEGDDFPPPRKTKAVHEPAPVNQPRVAVQTHLRADPKPKSKRWSLFFGYGLSSTLVFLIGIIWGWSFMPVQWTDASPSNLNLGFAADYLRMAVDSYRVNPDGTLAVERYQALGLLGPVAMDSVLENPGMTDMNAILNYKDVVAAVESSPIVDESRRSWDVIILFIVGICTAILVQFLFRIVLEKLSRKKTGNP